MDVKHIASYNLQTNILVCFYDVKEMCFLFFFKI